MEDPRQRLVLYERLTRTQDPAELDEFRYEFVDRYGPVPPPVENLIEVMKIRRALVALRATAFDYTGRELVLAFDEKPRVDPERVLELLRADPGAYRVTPDNRVIWVTGPLPPERVLPQAWELLNRLG